MTRKRFVKKHCAVCQINIPQGWIFCVNCEKIWGEYREYEWMKFLINSERREFRRSLNSPEILSLEDLEN